MRRLAIIVGLGFGVVSSPALGAPADEEEEEEDEEEATDEEGGDDEEESEDDTISVDDDKPKPKAKAKPEEFKKQDLRGHAVDAEAIANPFQKDRFFVDKVDTEKTENGTLVQGSLQASTFAYTERSGSLGTDLGNAASDFNRFFGDARLQMDFRHIGGGSWDARLDTRARMVNTPAEISAVSDEPNRIQSGFNGTNEYELREAWIVRSGKRSDVFFGRQFVPDLGAIRIDGLRIDYAQSEKLTLLGFGGLFPLRGSRSLTTDYEPLKDLTGQAAGQFIGAGGFGAAYRTPSTHGSFGGVVQYGLSGREPTRFYGVANGYYRTGPRLDLYHFAIVDVIGAAGLALTNLSTGVNYKPGQRLRLTASFNRVDTETLNIQAGQFLNPVDPVAGTKVQNETFIQRLSTNAVRGSVSAGLGSLQRFEITFAGAFRYRPDVTLVTPDTAAPDVTLAAAKGVEIYGAITDRQSFANLRLGFDVMRSVKIGSVAFQRSEVLAFRLSAARELNNGKGEWEAEVSYATPKDSAAGTDCTEMNGFSGPDKCFGSSTSTIISAGGNLYYRFNRDWFALTSLFVSKQDIARAMQQADPTITGVTGFLRAAYRF